MVEARRPPDGAGPTRTLDSTLRETFAAWYPGMAANDSPTSVAADAA